MTIALRWRRLLRRGRLVLSEQCLEPLAIAAQAPTRPVSMQPALMPARAEHVHCLGDRLLSHLLTLRARRRLLRPGWNHDGSLVVKLRA
jgi:hypothetical protein